MERAYFKTGIRLEKNQAGRGTRVCLEFSGWFLVLENYLGSRTESETVCSLLRFEALSTSENTGQSSGNVTNRAEA